MRLDNDPMTSSEFAAALRDAESGVVSSDTGATDEIESRLTDVAKSQPGPEREAAIAAARVAFARRLPNV